MQPRHESTHGQMRLASPGGRRQVTSFYVPSACQTTCKLFHRSVQSIVQSHKYRVQVWVVIAKQSSRMKSRESLAIPTDSDLAIVNSLLNCYVLISLPASLDCGLLRGGGEGLAITTHLSLYCREAGTGSRMSISGRRLRSQSPLDAGV